MASQQEIYHLTMCKGCEYRSKNGKQCELPMTKDCNMQDWEWVRDNAILYVSVLVQAGLRVGE